MIDDLDDQHFELLSYMVDADRRIPRDQREPFYFIGVGEGGFLSHPGIHDRTIFPRSDFLALSEAGLIRLTNLSGGGLGIDIKPHGYRIHARLIQSSTEPIQHMEKDVQRHLDAEAFSQRYPKVHAKWSAANLMLYAEDAHQHLTRIGHDCTEAMQDFADALVHRYDPPNVEQNTGAYIKRLDAVIDLFKPRVGANRAKLLHALVGYWVAASAIAERQEHGASKAGEPVTWEDARRVVFHTALVMFEVDRTLSDATR